MRTTVKHMKTITTKIMMKPTMSKKHLPQRNDLFQPPIKKNVALSKIDNTDAQNPVKNVLIYFVLNVVIVKVVI